MALVVEQHRPQAQPRSDSSRSAGAATTDRYWQDAHFPDPARPAGVRHPRHLPPGASDAS